jgi:hypothetical protein
MGALAVVALAVGVFVGLAHSARAADSPFVGTWKMTVFQGGQEITLVLVKVEIQDGKPKGTMLSVALSDLKDAAVEDLQADAKSLHFTLKTKEVVLPVAAYLPADGAKKMLGSWKVGPRTEPILMEKTDQKEIDPKSASSPAAGFAELQKIAGIEDAKERDAKLQELLDKSGDQPVSLVIAQVLVQVTVRDADKAADARAAVDRMIKVAAAYGPEMEYANTSQAVHMLKAVATTLRKAGKTDPAKEVDGRIAKLNDQLDKQFLQMAIPFQPEVYAGRKAKSERVAVVELFTGAQCPPCVAIDIAFDAALKTYKPSEVVFLQYHLHVPGPDPLTNADTEAREQYYGSDLPTPTTFVNGTKAALSGGFASMSKGKYEDLRKRIDEALETDTSAKLKLAVERKGDTLDVKAEVGDLKKIGDKMRLRFVLVEDVVHYPGVNNQRFHHHVVRAFPGGVEGLALNKKNEKKSASVSLAEVRKSLDDYLTAANKKMPFIDDDRPLDLKRLKIVALIQDEDSKEILQAAQVDVPEAK